MTTAQEAFMSLRVMPRRLWERFAPYTGLVLGALAWGLDQPLSSFSVFENCYHAAGQPVTAIGVACMVLASIGIVISWRSRRFAGDEGRAVIERRYFIAILSTFGAAMVMFALIAGTLASVILRCER